MSGDDESRPWTRSEVAQTGHRHDREIDGHHRRTGLVMDRKSGSYDETPWVQNSLGRRATPAPGPQGYLEAALEGRRIGFGSAYGSGTAAPLTSLQLDGPDHDGAE